MHRGVRRTEIFSDETDYQVFLEILKVALNKYQCKIHVVKPEDYRWSSYQTMIALKDDRITERNRTLAYFKDNSILRYRDFVEDIGHKYVVQEHEIKKSMEELPFD